MSFEQIFASATLDVAAPDTSLDLPSQEFVNDWLSRVRTGSVDRKQTFFDEQLGAVLILRIKQPASESDTPSQSLLTFLAHLQVSFEATYISPVVPDVPQDPRISLSTPPRGSSLPKGSSRLSLHPSIFPPNTPNPTPAAAERDRKYVTSEGTLLLAGIWGQSSSQDAKEGFTLLWSSEEQVWVAVYSFSLTVSFLRLNVSHPLLCLTVSATLRDKPITSASSKHPLAAFFAKLGNQSSLIEPDSPGPVNGDAQEDAPEGLNGFEEANLLQGLHAGPTFGMGTAKVTLPSTRLGIVSRQKLFSLPPINLPTPEPPEPSPMTALRAVHPTLRKSFRKTLHTVSGFRVRMRTVFVPYVLLPRKAGSSFISISDDGEDERDRREAGNEERTVVLCVEIENSGESGPNTGFQVEKVDVDVGGEDTEAHLIGWDDASLKNMDENAIFPLRIDACAQYNLLYAVWFLHPPDELKGPMLGRLRNSLNASSDLQRAVAIHIHGKPYEKQVQDDVTSPSAVSYPTHTFSSRWNCVLDLGAREPQTLDAVGEIDPLSSAGRYPNVLPEPPSPFPLSGSRAGGFLSPGYSTPGTTPRSAQMAGTQRLSLPTRAISPPNRTPSRYSDQQVYSPTSSNKSSYLLPSQSLAAAAHFLHSPTTYDPVFSPGYQSESGSQLEQPPLTPAYPPHSPYQPSPLSQGPIMPQGAGIVGPSVETRRERGSGFGPPSSALPLSPAPGGDGKAPLVEQAVSNKVLDKLDNGESIVVSVRLMSPRDREDWRDDEDIEEKIFPLSKFTIEVFVFNRSTWTRRFELSCPSAARMKRKERIMSQYGYDTVDDGKNKLDYPGILPVDNRVRIGPLLPSACQTVRMQFLAVTPGVHAIDALTLTDIESGYSVNLRSVMDVVVHEYTS